MGKFILIFRRYMKIIQKRKLYVTVENRVKKNVLMINTNVIISAQKVMIPHQKHKWEMRAKFTNRTNQIEPLHRKRQKQFPLSLVIKKKLKAHL